MKWIPLLILIVVLGFSTFGQTEDKIERPMNGFALSLLGDAALLSIHYDRLFKIKDHFLLSTKLGVGYHNNYKIICLSNDCGYNNYLIAPHHITVNYGKGKHFFEAGVGGSVLFGNQSQPYVFYPIIGYRVQPLNKKRVGFRFFVQLPLSSHLSKTSSIFKLEENMPFVPIGATISYWM